MSNVQPSPRYQFGPATNGLGIAGFVVSIASVLTCGLTSPIGLLLSLVALRKRPRGFALAGALLGGLGTALVAGTFGLTALTGRAIQEEIAHRVDAQETERAFLAATERVELYRAEHQGLPEGIEGNKLVIAFEDGWGEALRYDPLERGYALRSAGADRQFDTADDLIHEVPGGAVRETGQQTIDVR